MFLDHPPQGELSVARHGIGLVEDDELYTLGEQLTRSREFFDFVADYVDASRVGRVEFESHGVVGRAVHFFGGGDNGGCLPRRDGAGK